MKRDFINERNIILESVRFRISRKCIYCQWLVSSEHVRLRKLKVNHLYTLHIVYQYISHCEMYY